MLNHKGYTGHVEFDDEAGLFHGEVLDLKDVVTFQGRTEECISTPTLSSFTLQFLNSEIHKDSQIRAS